MPMRFATSPKTDSSQSSFAFRSASPSCSQSQGNLAIEQPAQSADKGNESFSRKKMTDLLRTVTRQQWTQSAAAAAAGYRSNPGSIPTFDRLIFKNGDPPI